MKDGQMDLFDWMAELKREPDVGTYLTKTGAVIPRIMRPAYIGKRVCIDKSTQSQTWYKVGILEKIVPDHYWHGEKRIECDRSVVFTGERQRSLITHMPGVEIFECLPWDAYPERMAAIGKGGNR